MFTTLTAQIVDRAILGLCADTAGLDSDVINTVTEPAGGAYNREEGIWIDAQSTKELLIASVVLAEAIGVGGAEAIASHLVVRRQGGAYGAESSYEAHLPGWTIGAHLR